VLNHLRASRQGSVVVVARCGATLFRHGRQFNMEDVPKGGVPGWALQFHDGTVKQSVSGIKIR
jgi:hypothetical protein